MKNFKTLHAIACSFADSLTESFHTVASAAALLKHHPEPDVQLQKSRHFLIPDAVSVVSGKQWLRNILLPALVGLSLGVIGSAYAQSEMESELSTAQPRMQRTAPTTVAMQEEAQQPGVTMLPFAHMGAPAPVRLRGVSSIKDLTFGVRLDETITRARLKLNFMHSPALLTGLSHLKIYLNDELVSTVALNKEEAGQALSREIEVDPRLLLESNRLRIQMIGHYTITECEDPWHTSLWVDLNSTSALTLWTSPLSLNDDLALLPAPFFDYRDSRPVRMSVVMPAKPSVGVQKAAAIVSSWFGGLAAYRTASFSVSSTFPANSHAIVFATRGQNIQGLDMGRIDGPMLVMQANPVASDKKILLVLGRDEKELQTAALALTSGQVALSGPSTLVKNIDIGSERKAYDAPSWVRTDRVVRFGELVKRPEELQAVGSPFGEFGAEVVRVNLRVPPDLFIWKDKNVLVNLKYRFMPPNRFGDARLTMDINDMLVDSFSLLNPEWREAQNARTALMPVTSLPATGDVDIKLPGFRIGGDNQMQFRFHLASEKIGHCETTILQTLRGDIDPDSTIDFSAFPHYLQMPNLTAFANNGFPFTKYADLSKTAVVMPDAPTAEDLGSMLTLMGRMGFWTGLPAQRVTIVEAADVKSASDKDLLVIANGSAKSLLDNWNKSLPMMLSNIERQVQIDRPSYFSAWWNDVWQIKQEGKQFEKNLQKLTLRTDGALGALMGFRSPLDGGQNVVALTGARDSEVHTLLVANLLKSDQVAKIRGDVMLFNAQQGQGFDVGDKYFIGNVPLWTRIQIYFYRLPVMLSIAGLLAGLLIAVLLYWLLTRRSAARLRNR